MKFFILIFSVMAAPAWAASGGMDGGGGQGLLCEPAHGHRTLRALDLYEAETVWGYGIPPSAKNMIEEYRRVFPNDQLFSDVYVSQRLGPPPTLPPETVNKYFAQFRKEFESRLHSIPAGTHLNLSHDAGNPILQPPGYCKVVQVLFYADEDYESGKILVDQAYWKLLSPQDQLAFLYHEHIYKWQRALGVKDSRDVRKVIGLLFRDQPFPGLVAPTYGVDNLQICFAEAGGGPDGSITFFLVPHLVQDTRYARLVFTHLGALPEPMVETTFDSIWNYDKWVNGEPFDTSGYVSWTKSALGSRRVALGFTDRECLDKNEKCVPTIRIEDERGGWVGGEISCQSFRKR